MHETISAFLLFCQTLGAIIGVVAVVVGESAYILAMRDGRIDEAERAHLHIIARGLRFGMLVILVASLGLVIESYNMRTAPQPALTTDYWNFVALAVVVTGVTWALSRRLVTFAIGSAVIFTGWIFLAFASMDKLSGTAFGSMIALFVVSSAVVYGILRYVRMLSSQNTA